MAQLSNQLTYVARLLRPDRLTDALCAGFAAWTVLCNIVVMAGGSLDDLLLAFAAAALSAAIGFAVHRHTRSANGDLLTDSIVSEQEEEAMPAPVRTRRWLAWTAAAGLAVWIGAVIGLSTGTLWALSTTVVVVGASLVLVQPTAPGTVSATPQFSIVWALALICAVVTLCANRPDMDDALYINMAASAADHPDAPLLARDHLHGLDDVPMVLPTYRAHSLEPLAGGMARLTGLPAVFWLHLVFAPVAAMLAVFVIARLARLVAPGRWLATTAATVAILLVVGDTHAWYSNLAFVRLHQGKGIFLTVMVPLILAYGIEAVRHPSRKNWLRLAGVQVVAIGVTATALWLAPALAVTGVLLSIRPDRKGLRNIGIAVITTFYALTLAMGFWHTYYRPNSVLSRVFSGRSASVRTPGAVPEKVHRETIEANVRIAETVSKVVGDGRLRLAVFGLLLWGWWLSPETMVRRLNLVCTAVFAVVFLNPYLVPLVATSVTGEWTFWRVSWILPVPLLAGLALTSPVVRLPGWRGPAAAAGLTALVLTFIPSARVFGSADGARIGAPSLKVPAEYEVARALVELVPEGSMVVAPIEVAPWVATFHHPPYPVVVRLQYVHMVEAALGPKATNRRVKAVLAVTKPHARGRPLFNLFKLVDTSPVVGVVVASDSDPTSRLERGLQKRGFSREWSGPGYQIWIRSESAIQALLDHP